VIRLNVGHYLRRHKNYYNDLNVPANFQLQRHLDLLRRHLLARCVVEMSRLILFVMRCLRN
jgi:hypothetical protein